MHLLAEWFIFGGDDRGFLKEGVKTYLMSPMYLITRQFFSFLVFTSIVYGFTGSLE
jgi:hypothetical protein